MEEIKSKHTPGSWSAFKTDILVDGWKTVCQANSETDAIRIVECVNALEGIENPLEWVINIKKELSFYKQQHDDLSKNFIALMNETKR